jgi:hypothetical protein
MRISICDTALEEDPNNLDLWRFRYYAGKKGD